ncbi:MAG: type I-C CRISPR-associated protein Cas7/Csd2 [Clostridiales bacterium]|jgi:CRISPR-associated protein Csd2|nr:type I-C CRISPR-associated protein Cas7/Csd2 [Eubacteriales bacterium]MDH7565865.1 type I-C CRISPR-associated protein Cas7/Csd2 [Clostridiales bacterium]
METLKNKIDFAVIIHVKNANPNGDPLNGNRPRINYDGLGEISDVCIKRKIRNRLLEAGKAIFVQSDDNRVDGYRSLRARADGELKDFQKDEERFQLEACKKWLDVRAFGQVFAFKGGEDKGVSIGIRGPVSIHSAFSVSPVSVSSIQITKSVSGEGDGKRKASDTMGMKHRVDHGLYIFYGSINPQLADKTGFSEEDAESIKDALIHLFQNDASSARPEGSMEVYKIYWWQHNCRNGQYPSAKVHRSLQVSVKPGVNEPRDTTDYDIKLEPLDGLTPEIIDGF